jgi:hypothetical protein
MIEGPYQPRAWTVMGDADWESPNDSKKPPDKRHPYPGEIELLEAEARKSAGRPRYEYKVAAWQSRVSKLFYALCVSRRIYIEGM